MAKHGRKRNNNALYARAYANITGVLCFCCHKCHKNYITHYVIIIYIDFRNNVPHCHPFTLLLHPKNSPKHHPQNNFSTSNPKQPVTFHKTTRHVPQNDTLFFWGDEVFSIPSAVTLVTAKKQNSSMGARIRAREKPLRPAQNNLRT